MGGLGQLYAGQASLVPPLDIPVIAACMLHNGAAVKVIECLGLRYDLTMLVRSIEDCTG